MAVVHPDPAVQGSLEGGDAQEGHCLVMVDSLTNGTVYARMDEAIRDGASRCEATVAACPDALATLAGDGTAEEPYALPVAFVCPAAL